MSRKGIFIMFDFIPAYIYSTVFFNSLLLIVIATFFKILRTNRLGESNYEVNNFLGITLVVFVTLYIGYRPISYHFGDMLSYAHNFNIKKYGINDILNNNQSDLLFDLFTILCVKIFTPQQYFFIISILYVVPLYIASKKLFKEQWVLGFLMLITTMSFWSYGTNGIRNGLATSIFVLAISLKRNYLTLILILASVAIHRSMALTALAYFITIFINKPSYFLKFWFACIPISLIAGSTIEQYLISIDFFANDRIVSYLGNNRQNIDYNVGFRWDFLLYSSVGVFAGWYFIFKLKVRDRLYYRLFNIYLFANAFWILIIRAPFSNRFAYLSWFLISIVLIYPLLKFQVIKKQPQIVGQILLVNFAFTYILTTILGK